MQVVHCPRFQHGGAVGAGHAGQGVEAGRVVLLGRAENGEGGIGARGALAVGSDLLLQLERGVNRAVCGLNHHVRRHRGGGAEKPAFIAPANESHPGYAWGAGHTAHGAAVGDEGCVDLLPLGGEGDRVVLAARGHQLIPVGEALRPDRQIGRQGGQQHGQNQQAGCKSLDLHKQNLPLPEELIAPARGGDGNH